MRAERLPRAARVSFPGLALVLAAALPFTARAGCDLARFGEPAPRSCARASADCVPAYLPDEVKAIGRGVVVEWVGLAVNDGRASWHALDVERSELVIVERYSGAKLGQAPAPAAPTPHGSVRASGEGASRSVDEVRRWPLSKARLASLACPLAATGTGAPVPVRELTDMASRLYLLLPEKAQVDQANGRFGGTAGRLERALDGLARRHPPGSTVR